MCASAPMRQECCSTFGAVNTQAVKGIAEKADDHLLAILVRELRYPLVPIRNAAALLKQEFPEHVTVRRAADTIESHASDMGRLISDLLDVSLVRQGKMHLRRGVVPLGRVIDTALKSSEGFANDRGHHITRSVAPENLHVRVDVTRLAQALRCVFANATCYTDRGGLIHVRAERQGAHAVLMVRDTGIGMARDELERIFGLFCRSAQGGRVEPGLGIGLYLARHLIEAHGGTIRAASAGMGLGCEFTIRLPTVLAIAAPETDFEEPADDLSPA
jgi:signal transduction histidine kinase